MEFLLKLNDSDLLMLPVTPADFSIQTGQQNQSIQISKLGEVNLWGPEKLDGITVQSFFPTDLEASYVINRFAPQPWDCVALVNKWRRSGKPIRLIITDSKLMVDINMECLIESFDYSVKDGTGDVYFNMVLKKYAYIIIPKIDAPNAPVLQRPVPPVKQAPITGASNGSTAAKRTHTVKAGDSLWSLAKKYYGNGSLFTKIAAANKDKIKDPNLIIDGWVLVIP